MERSATIGTVMTRMIACCLTLPPYRSKFNTALGVEAQGFCVVPPR
jgi:hypothetical protein